MSTKPTEQEKREWIEKSKVRYEFINIQNDYASRPKDYGTGELINMVEMHTLAAIYDDPGITVTALAAQTNRTKAAVSQVITKLEKRGLLVRTKSLENGKISVMTITPKGYELCRAHIQFDEVHEARALENLLKSVTMDDIRTFYKVLEAYIKLFK